ncbi:hypothetical protein CASFOL_016313 [Castilleja foliolosa]|uniref:Leucine-rich repeat-containing N-terminal plant-type domain-containing protein n=1 Tax=Castilleja foliolosa TaxID=1961234 RepID=A0ABD3DG86_9LAMI
MSSMNSCFVFAVVLLLLCSIHKPFSAKTLDLTTDQTALLAFKNTITWNAMLPNNWSSNTSVCNWIGVSCGIKHQRVTALNISGFGLSGTLPPHLGNLTFLRYLDMSFNNFTGPIPFELSRLYRLKEIQMRVNSFTGKIPSWFGALPQLEYLNLDNNTFSGTIPKEIANCSSLQILDLSYNEYLTGPIPHGLFNLSSVRVFQMVFSGLSGTLPSDMCNNLPNLIFLSLSANQIEGQIPRNILKCRVLKGLSLSENRFNGEIPSEIGSLSMLRELYLGLNDFKQGGIPTEFGNLSRLEYLSIPGRPIPKQLGHCTFLESIYLRDNYLSGELPQEFGNLTFLEKFNVFNNSLSSSIPSSIFNISSLKRLDLSTNQFSGKLILPRKKLNLEFLILAENELSGEIPSSITNASMLTDLELSLNSFSGSMPNFGNLRFLQILLLWNNSLTGQDSPNQELEFLTSLTNCRFLEELGIAGNPLNGILPPSIGNLSASLQMLGVRNIGIKTPLLLTKSSPTAHQKLTKLSTTKHTLSILYIQSIYCHGQKITYFLRLMISAALYRKQPSSTVLSMNSSPVFTFVILPLRLRGRVRNIGIKTPLLLTKSSPTAHQKLTKLSTTKHTLSILYIQCYIHPFIMGICNNHHLSLGAFKCKINGPIPSTIGNLSNLKTLLLYGNQLTGTISPTIGNLKQLQVLQLDRNKLQGYIPSDICRLSNIGILHLNDNNLTGPIPDCLGDVTALRDINLGSNKLNSIIPSNFWNLKDLLFLNLSSNYLTGQLSSQITSMKVMNILDLSHNQLSGEIPSSIDGCQSLEILSLSNNKFGGSIPPSLGKARGLITLDLSHNNLSGTIPDFLEDLKFLQYFNVSYNSLEGEIPTGAIYPGSVSEINSDIPELKGDNYKVWRERVLLQLGWMDIDYAIRKDEPSSITEASSPDKVDLYEKWERSNRLSVMFIKTKICASIRGSVDKHNNVRDLLKAIDEQFAHSEKALASTLIMEFSSMRHNGLKGVRDYIMHMRDIAAKLKDLEVTMSETFLVHFILCTLPSQYGPFKISYNTHKDKWSINELMTMCVQEEGRLRMEEGEKVNLTTASSSKKNKGHHKGKEKGLDKLGHKEGVHVLLL